MSFPTFVPASEPRSGTHCDGRVYDLHIGLFNENLARLDTETLHLFFRDGLAPEELLYLPGARSSMGGPRAEWTNTNLSRSLGIFRSEVQMKELYSDFEIISRCVWRVEGREDAR